MSTFKYLTNRTLLNKAGAETGRIRVMVKHDSDLAEGDYSCPECKAAGKISQPWKKPFNVKCTSCGLLIRIPKLVNKKKKAA